MAAPPRTLPADFFEAAAKGPPKSLPADFFEREPKPETFTIPGGEELPFVGPRRGTHYQEQVAAMGGMPPTMPPPLEVARRAVPAPETVVGRGGALLSKEHEYAQMIGRMPSMRDAIMPVIVGEIGHLVPAPETTTEAIGNAIAKTAVGLMSAKGLATLLAAGGIGSGLSALANSPKVAVALRGYPEVLKGIDLASKTAIPATFGGMGAVGTVEALEAAEQAETEPERVEALTHAGLSGVIAAAGAAGVVKGARRPYHEWEFGQRRAPTSKQIAAPKEPRPSKPKPTPAAVEAAPAQPRATPAAPEQYDKALKLVQGQKENVVSRRPLVDGLAINYREAEALMGRMVDEGHVKPLPLNRYEVVRAEAEKAVEKPKPAPLAAKRPSPPPEVVAPAKAAPPKAEARQPTQEAALTPAERRIEIDRLKEGISQGEMRLRSKVNAIGEKLTEGELLSTRKSVENTRARLAQLQPTAKPAKPAAKQPTQEAALTPAQLRQRAKRMVVRPDIQERIDAEVAAAAKQPWEMTREEFRSRHKPTRGFQRYTSEDRATRQASIRLGLSAKEKVGEFFYSTELIPDRAFPTAGGAVDAARHKTIEAALREGKPIPPAVLADYPDLAKPKPAAKPGSVTLGSGLGSIQEYFDRPLSPLVTRNLQTVANAIDDVAVRKALKMLLPVETRISMAGGKAGEKLAKSIERVSGWGKVSAGKRLVRLSDAQMDKLDHDQRFEFLDALEGRGDAQDAAVQTALKPSREILDEIGAEAEGMEVLVQHSAGRKPFEGRENYYPHVFRGPSAMRRGQLRKDIIENLTHHLKVRSTEPSAEKFLDEYIQSLETGEWHDSIQQHLIDTGQATTKAEALKRLNRFRTPVRRQGNLEFAREVDLPFYDPDPVRVLPQHIMAASIRLAEVLEYGQENTVIARAVKEIAEIPGNIRTQQERAAWVELAMKRVIGWVDQAEAPAERISRALRAIQGFKLGLAAIPNATQGTLNGLLALDLPSVAVGFASMFSRGGRRFAVEAGALVDPLLHETVEDVTESNRATRMLQESLRAYLRAVGFTGTERMNRTLAANAGAYFAERQMRRLRANPSDKPARGLLEDMGLDVDAALKRGGLGRDDVLMAANWTSRITQFGADPAKAPLWFSTPAGKAFMQYKNFPYNQTRLVYRSVIGEFQKGRPGRGFRNLLLLAALFPLAGEIVKDLRDLFTGRKRKEDLLSFDRYLEDIGQASATGVFMDVAESAKYGRLWGVGAGPTGGDVVDLVGGVGLGYSQWGTKTSRLRAFQRFMEARSPLVRVGKNVPKKTAEWYRSRHK